jgi:mannitol/fructose-specific phosphotransferase system IIA component (Ntr-type)
MKFADFVCFEAVIAKLKSTSRDGAITELVSAIDKAGKLGKGNREEIIKAAIKREKEASTGIGKGVAIPHIKHSSVKNVVAAIGQSLISPVDEPDRHLQAMENVFKHLQQEKFRKFLRQSETASQIEDLLREADENSFM